MTTDIGSVAMAGAGDGGGSARWRYLCYGDDAGTRNCAVDGSWCDGGGGGGGVTQVVLWCS